MTIVKVGIIGAGYIAGVHSGILARDERVRVAEVFDVDAARAERLALTCSARVARSVESLIGSVDAAFITTPNTRHTEIALAAIRAGKHVLCEKPMATSVREATEVRDAASASAGVFQVGHNRRFAPVYATLRRLITEEGLPHSAHIKMNRGELKNPEWVGDSTITGGFLYETTIHMFDLMRFLFGDVAEMTALGSRHEYGEIDNFSVLLNFKNGMHATLCSSAESGWLFPFERVEVFGGHRTFATREMEALIVSEGLSGEHATHSMHQLPKEEKWGYAQEDRAFIDSIVGGNEVPVTAMDGYKSVELVDACYRAVQSGERVKL